MLFEYGYGLRDQALGYAVSILLGRSAGGTAGPLCRVPSMFGVSLIPSYSFSLSLRPSLGLSVVVDHQ